ncbi:MAG: hypothetical protein FWD23_16795, partial [Oscillospiraceae bacterium]|nr:hypothetical protein [Oscillospiraceae bacterium]
MSKKIRITAIFLIVCIVIIMVAACGGNSNNGNAPDSKDSVNDDKSENGDGQNDEADDGSRDNVRDSLPDGLDFNGTEIRILHRDDFDAWIDEIAIEGEIGEIVNDALYHRNKKVEERLNIQITPMPATGGWDSRNSFLNKIRNSVNAGSDDIDLIAGYAYYIPTIAPEGMLYNLNNVNYLNPTAPWWSENCANEMTIDGKMYLITGDLAYTLLRNMFVVYFNKQIAQDMGLDNLYRIVLDGDFTVDKIVELSKDVYKDLNGNGKPDKSDQYGFAMTTGVYVDGLFDAFAQPIVKKDANGIPQLVINSPRMVEIVEKTYDFFYNNESIYAVSEYTSGNEQSIM